MADLSAISIAINGVDNLSGPAGSAVGALGRVEGAAGSVTGKMVGMAEAAAKAAVAIGAITFTGAIAGMTSAISVASSFQQELSNIAAVSSKAEVETVGGMKAIGDAALQLGKDTSFTASQAAAGMEEMVKAGVSLTDVMGGGAKAALDLAAAGALSVAEAATVASNAMNAFALSGKDLPHIADELANAANASATDVHQLGFALAAVGAVAHTIGFSFDDTATAIATFAQAGLHGSDAGTSLKTMLLNLTPSTKTAKAEMEQLGIITADGGNQFFDATGKVKSMAEVAQVLQTATANLTKEQKINALQTIFGTDAIRAAAILAEQGAAGINKMADAEAAVGGASAVANERLNNLRGSLEKLQGTLEVIRIKFGAPFLPILQRGVDALTESLNKNEPAISAFAERMAAGLDRMIARAQVAAPAFLAMAGGVKTFASSLVLLAQGAIPRLIEGFDRLKTLAGGLNIGGAASGARSLLGGLIGTFKQIVPIAMTVGHAIVQNITDTFDFLATRVLPPVVSMVEQIGDVLTRTLLPASAATGATMRGILGDTLDWLAKTVFPPFLSIVTQTSNLFTSVILPTLPAIAGALRQTLGETVQWLADTVWPKFTAAATLAWGFIAGTIAPALPGFVAMLRDGLGKALEWVATTGWPMLVTGATIAWKFLTDNVIPAIRDTISWLQQKLPPAITAVTGAWEALRGTVGPIIEAVFSGDIKDAISKLGTAFSDFATLATGWLKDQASQIKWEEVWTAVVDAGTKLGTYLLGLAVDFAGWLKQEVGKIPWETVWATIVGAGTKLGTYLLGLAVDFTTWLGQQVGQIKWEAVWTSAVNVVETMAPLFLTAGTYITTWLGKQVETIEWATVWAQTKLTAVALVGYVWEKLTGLDSELTKKINESVAAVKWTEVGEAFGTGLSGAITGSVSGGGEGGGGTQLDTAAIGKALTDFLTGVLKTTIKDAWDAAWKDFWSTPPEVGTPGGPTVVAPQFPGMFVPPGPRPSQAPAGGGGGQNLSMPSSYTADWEKEAYQAAVDAGHPNPRQFVEQIREESNGNPNAYNATSGATGIAQIVPQYHPGVDPTDPHASLRYSANLMAQNIRTYGDPNVALAAYNAGPGAVARYGGVPPYAETQRYVGEINARTNALPSTVNLANQVGTATRPPANINTLAFPIKNQFDLGLPWDQAIAACGPAAVALFMEASGRTPNSQEVVQIAAKNGWTSAAGMGGVEAFKKTLSDEGVNFATLPTTAEAAQQSAAGGNLTAISTPGHYFVAQGFDQQSQKFDLGATGGGSGGALADPRASRFMSAEEIQALEGPINGVIQLLGAVPPAAGAAAASLPPITDNLQGVTAATVDTAPGVTATSAALETVPPAAEAVAPATEMVSAAFDLMSADSLQSVTDLGTGVLTTTQDMSGNTIATITDMTGQVTSQSATLASGVSLNMADMGTLSSASVDAMTGNITTVMTDMAGNAVTTVTNASGQVVGQFATMNTQAGSAVAQLAGKSKTEFNAIGSAASSTHGPITGVDKDMASIRPPDLSSSISEFNKLTKAAEAAGNAVAKVSGGDFKKSESAAKAIGGHASGGWVGLNGPELSWLGERGPEYVIPNNALRGGGSGSGGTTVVLNVNVGGSVTSERDLLETIRTGLIDIGKRNSIDVLSGGGG